MKWFNDPRGYGFIARPGWPDIFIHISAVRGEDVTTLNKGDRVEFAVVQGRKGRQAEDAVVLEPAQAPETPSNGSSAPLQGDEEQTMGPDRPESESMFAAANNLLCRLRAMAPVAMGCSAFALAVESPPLDGF